MKQGSTEQRLDSGSDPKMSDRAGVRASVLQVEKAGPILKIIINRPESRNALNRDTLAKLKAAFSDHADDMELRLVIVSGAGGQAFAAGGDLKELMAVKTSAQAQQMADSTKSAFQAIRDFPVPVIAALNGDALGGGAELAVACDMRVAAGRVRIGFIQGRLNISTAWGGGHDLIRLVGPATALRLLSRSELLDMPTAHALGLVDCVANDDENLDVTVERFSAPILSQAPQVLRTFKALTRQAKNAGRATLDRLETERLAANWVHDDHWKAANNLFRKKD